MFEKKSRRRHKRSSEDGVGRNIESYSTPNEAQIRKNGGASFCIVIALNQDDPFVRIFFETYYFEKNQIPERMKWVTDDGGKQ